MSGIEYLAHFSARKRLEFKMASWKNVKIVFGVLMVLRKREQNFQYREVRVRRRINRYIEPGMLNNPVHELVTEDAVIFTRNFRPNTSTFVKAVEFARPLITRQDINTRKAISLILQKSFLPQIY